ncbi:MAG: hypothetical protein M1827_001770 [Pycnora praestabilis]|nr:MAG: hypothetical protein M1827_001770 [Pycnora praestabilis]
MTEVITHIVLFKYSLTLSWTDLESHFSTFLALRTTCLKPPKTGKPYMKSMKAGKAGLSSVPWIDKWVAMGGYWADGTGVIGKNVSWEAFGKGMTHGFVLEFENQVGAKARVYATADLDYYITQDPVHIEFSKSATDLM